MTTFLIVLGFVAAEALEALELWLLIRPIRRRLKRLEEPPTKNLLT